MATKKTKTLKELVEDFNATSNAYHDDLAARQRDIDIAQLETVQQAVTELTAPEVVALIERLTVLSDNLTGQMANYVGGIVQQWHQSVPNLQSEADRIAGLKAALEGEGAAQ